MKIEKVIDQLKDLIKDRHSFISEGEEVEWDEIYIKDLTLLIKLWKLYIKRYRKLL